MNSESSELEPGLNDKVVLLTGSNNPHGIGAAVAQAFAAQGAELFLHYFRQLDARAPLSRGAEAQRPARPASNSTALSRRSPLTKFLNGFVIFVRNGWKALLDS